VAVNLDKPNRWKADVAQSVDMYNQWFLEFAPKTYHETRIIATEQVKNALDLTQNLTSIQPEILRQYPSLLPVLRMSTVPPLARDRLIGLAGVVPHLVDSMEVRQQIPPKILPALLDRELRKIGAVIEQLADKDICGWLEDKHIPTEAEVYRAATIIADRLCGAAADPIIRNAQEKRQLQVLRRWLESRGYSLTENNAGLKFSDMSPGTFSFRLNMPIKRDNGIKINMPIDTVIMPKVVESSNLPILIEAKSAGDYTNTNKRRKEEATKFYQLRNEYGDHIKFVLLLCGYFDAGYLGCEAAEGIDWIWEHRLDDLLELGI
jgi:hypothetical protein